MADRFCANCGTEVDEDARFCPTCGMTLGEERPDLPSAPDWAQPEPGPSEPERAEPTAPTEEPPRGTWEPAPAAGVAQAVAPEPEAAAVVEPMAEEPVVEAQPAADAAAPPPDQPIEEEEVSSAMAPELEPGQPPPPPLPPPAEAAWELPAPPVPPAQPAPRSIAADLPFTWPATLSGWLIGAGSGIAALALIPRLGNGLSILLFVALLGVTASVFLADRLPEIPRLRLLVLVVTMIGLGMALERAAFTVRGLETLFLLSMLVAAGGVLLVELDRDRPVPPPGGPGA